MKLLKYFDIAKIIIFILVLLTLVTSASFAWLSGIRNVESEGINMSVASEICPEIVVYTYYTEEEALLTDGVDGEGWIESLIDIQSTNFNKVVYGYNIYSSNHFVLSSLPLGTIDNLVKPKLDNTIYLRFAFNPKGINDKFFMSVRNATFVGNDGQYPFAIYDNDDNLVNPQDSGVYEEIRNKIEGELLELFDLQFAFSNEALEPNDNEFSNMAFFDAIDGEFEFPNSNVQNYSVDNYYLYVKIYPNPSAFANIAKSLYRYMPCVFLHDFDIQYGIEMTER